MSNRLEADKKDRRPPPSESWKTFARSLPAHRRKAIYRKLTDIQRGVASDAGRWELVGRREQLAPPRPWFVWAMIAGRGFGKTRAGAEHVIARHRRGLAKSSAIVAPTTTDVRKTCLQGVSGILQIAPKRFYPEWKKQDKKLVWPNGTETHLYSAFEPERLRGGNHDLAWCDEMAAWEYLVDAWENLEMMLREVGQPEVVITTTPKPRQALIDIIEDPDTVVTGGSSFDNIDNLSERWIERMRRIYEGTRVGRQELFAEVLQEAEGALWQRDWLKYTSKKPDDIRRIAVGVDPMIGRPRVKKGDVAANETGIVVAGAREDFRYVVLEDCSGSMLPNEWARTALFAYFRHGANVLVAEKNQGGEMVEAVITATAKEMRAKGEIPNEPIHLSTVWASHSKQARAEPVSALYEQGRVVHFVTEDSRLVKLENELCVWEPNSGAESPNRLDALTWAMTEIMEQAPILGDVAIAGDAPEAATVEGVF